MKPIIRDMNGKEVKPGDLLQQVKGWYGMTSFHYHVCYDDGANYSPEIRDLGANNVGMCNPETECVNLGHITQCYKSLPLNEYGERIWNADDWEYYFNIRAYKSPDQDPYNVACMTPKQIMISRKRNNFPEGWELPEEDKT